MKKIILITFIFMLTYKFASSQFYPDNLNSLNPISIDAIETNGTNIDYQYVGSDNEQEETTDTTAIKNRIVSVVKISSKYYVEVELEEQNTQIEIKVFNMLGKLVVDVYNGSANNGDKFDFDANLLNGIYICVLIGPNIRDAEKFIVSR